MLKALLDLAQMALVRRAIPTSIQRRHDLYLLSLFEKRPSSSRPAPMRSSLRRQLLHLATDLSALAAHPDDLGHGFDLLTRSYATPVADAARAALRRAARCKHH